MFEVMIIDDDAQVRDRLKTIIDWDGLELSLCCEAADSLSARELYLLKRPKIIITDINIPIISGLDLVEEFKALDPDLRVIVITGYSDFDLVRKSVNLGAVDLLSKPLFADEINKSLKNALDYFADIRAQRASIAALRQLVEANLPALQLSFMANLLHQTPKNPSSVAERMLQLHIDCPGPRYAVALIMFETPVDDDADSESYGLLLRQTLTHALEAADLRAYYEQDTHGRLNCIISTADVRPDNLIEETLVRVQEQISFLLGRRIVAGIGPTVNDPAALHDSWSGALTALNYQCVLDNASVMHFKNLERTETYFHSQETIHGYLMQMFRENNFPAIAGALRNHVSILSSYGKDGVKQLREFFFEYFIGVTHEALRLGLEPERTEACAPAMLQLCQDSDASERCAAVLGLTEQLLGQLFSRRDTNASHLIDAAKDYVRENLRDDLLCLDSVSNHIGLSRIYFCKLFHQVEGVSFNNFLKQERINRAKQLLTGTNMKVFEISDAVGFSNAKYFSYVFKQTVGQTPLEYQKTAAHA